MQLKTAGRKEFPLVIKGDVQGSVEAILGALDKLGTDEVGARILHAGVGGITESDVTLAEGVNAAIIGFNVRAHKEARAAASAGIEIRYYNIIYDLVDDVKKAMSGLLAPTLRETMLGNAVILEVFNISKVGKVAGCRVTDGTVERGANVRLIRDNVVVHEGKLSTLKRFKDEVKEVAVRSGMRHGVRELRRHARRRRHRVLSRRDDPALSVSPNLAGRSAWLHAVEPRLFGRRPEEGIQHPDPVGKLRPAIPVVRFSRVTTQIEKRNAPPPPKDFRSRRLATTVARRRNRASCDRGHSGAGRRA